MAERVGDPAWKVSLRGHHNELRTGIIIANLLPALRPLLTEIEYSRVNDKPSNVDGIDVLIEILLTKEERTFDRFCDTLETNGYGHWKSKLKGKGIFSG